VGTPAETPTTFEQFVTNRIAPPARCQALVMVQGIVVKHADKKTIEVAGIEFTQPPDRIAQLLETAKEGDKAIASYWPNIDGSPESLMSLKEGLAFKELVAPVMILRGYVRGRAGDQTIRVRVEYRREGQRGDKDFEIMLARPLMENPHPRDMMEFRAVYMKGRWIATPVPSRRPPPRMGPPRGPRPGPRPAPAGSRPHPRDSAGPRPGGRTG
jgi:hypothetical protein